MLAAGKINADEAERLMAALENGAAQASTAAGGDGKSKAKYIHVQVDAENQGKTPTKVNIRVPLLLLRSGVRLAGLIPVQAREHMEEAMRKNGVTMDLSSIRPENLEDIVDQLQDLTIDVDDDNAKVRIYAE
jgi:hypothetical protein